MPRGAGVRGQRAEERLGPGGGGARPWALDEGGGAYDYGGYVAAFLVSEIDGVWGKETTVSGALRVEAVRSVSRASAGSCVAGGFYLGPGQGFVTQ